MSDDRTQPLPTSTGAGPTPTPEHAPAGEHVPHGQSHTGHPHTGHPHPLPPQTHPAHGGPYSGQHPAPHPPAPAPRPTNGAAIGALVSGLVALLLCLVPVVNVVSVLGGLAAVVLGVVGLRAARTRHGSGKGMSITGLVTGLVAVVVAAIILALTVSAVRQVQEQTSDVQRLLGDLQGLEEGALPDLEGLLGGEGLDVDDLARGLGELDLPAPTAPEPTATVGIGEPVTDGDLEFTVTGYEPGGTTLGEGPGQVEADGAFLLVHVSVRNTGTTSALVVGTLQLLVDDQGQAHTVDLPSVLAAPESALAAQLEPGATSEGTLVYDLPADVSPDRVVLTGTMLTTAVAVDLG